MTKIVIDKNIFIVLLTITLASMQGQAAHYLHYNKSGDKVLEPNSLMVNNTSTCQPWFLYDNASGECLCGDELNGIISCDNEENNVYIINCYCMTHDNQLGITVGTCFTNCILQESNTKFLKYLKVPRSLEQLNEDMCGERWNRTGRLCGQCKHGHYPLAYSYDIKCINCITADAYNWLKYISSAFLPLTVFFVFVLGFGISATSPQLEAFIMFAQVITAPSSVRMILEALDTYKYLSYQIVYRMIISLYGVWNLDFFRTLLPQNCLKLNSLQVLALDYVIAVYPLALIFVTYIIIDLYDRQFFPLVWILKPFRNCLKSVDNSMHIKSSILNTFITFILLSYGKFLTVSFDLLVFNKVYSPSGKSVGTVLFYDASIDYFGREHLPYGILAIVVTFLFIIVPLLFTLIHPLKCFKGHLGKWPALRICLDSFQGCYKDGTEGTRDCRFFSSLYLVIRIVLFIVYGVVKDGTFYPLASVLLLLLVAFVILFQPFKPQFKVYNSVHALLFLNLAVLSLNVTCINNVHQKTSITSKFLFALSIVICLFPFIYIIYLLLKWLYSQRLFQYYFLKYCTYCQRWNVDESLPHQMEGLSEEQPFHTTRNLATSQYGSIQSKEISAY